MEILVQANCSRRHRSDDRAGGALLPRGVALFNEVGVLRGEALFLAEPFVTSVRLHAPAHCVFQGMPGHHGFFTDEEGGRRWRSRSCPWRKIVRYCG